MLIVTLISLVVAAASGFIAWRSIRREHLRSDARVALLATAIDSIPPREGPALVDGIDWFRHETEPPSAPPAPLFDEQVHSPRRPPLLTAGIGLAVVLSVVVLIAMTGDRYDLPKAASVPTRSESLELLSLQADRDGASLAVTGLVRNRADEPLNAVTAIVSAVDVAGRAVGSGSTPLTALAPGGQSRFVVTIARVSGVARYRVSFRDATGVIRHVDHRVDRTSDVS